MLPLNYSKCTIQGALVLVLLASYFVCQCFADLPSDIEEDLEDDDDPEYLEKRQIGGSSKSVQHGPNAQDFDPGVPVPFGVDDLLRKPRTPGPQEPTTEEEPELATDEPNVATDEPNVGTDEPNVGTDEPTSVIKLPDDPDGELDESTTPFKKEDVGQPLTIKKTTLYQGCGKTKSCFGFPDGCIKKRRCWLALALWEDDDDTDEGGINKIAGKEFVNIAVAATNPATRGYVSVGFSSDEYMGDDFVVSCLHVLSGPEVFIQKSHNNRHYQNIKTNPNTLARIVVGFAQINGVLSCFLKIEPKGTYTIAGTNESISYDLLTKKHHILMAFGRYNDKIGDKFGRLQGHYAAVASKEAFSLKELYKSPKILNVYQSKSIQWHAITSIIVHAFLLPAAVILAKYGQEAFSMPIERLNDIPLWNVVHIIMTGLSVTLSLLGVIVIAKEIGWQSHTTNIAKMHSCLGILIFVMYLFSCLSGFYLWWKQDDVEHYFAGKTNISRWFHWIIGNISVLIGMLILIFSPEMKRAQVPCIFRYLAILLLIVHVLTVVVMSFHTYWLSTILGSKIRLQLATVGPIVPFEPETDEMYSNFYKLEAWSGRRRAVIFYFIATALICIGMIVVMSIPVTLCIN